MKLKMTATATRLLALVLALSMLATTIGCGKRDVSSSTDSSDTEASSLTNSSLPEDTDTANRVFLIEEIDRAIERNNDTKGWIYIPNTKINQAVLQRTSADKTHKENNEYYLRMDEDKKYDIFGCYWADPDSRMGSRDALSRNTIIYGHSDYKDTGEGKRFSELFKYNNIDFLKNNPYVYFSTPEDDMVWQIFSVFYTKTTFNYIQANPSEQGFQALVKEALAKSEYLIDTTVGPDDKILTLSTCTGLFKPGDHDNYRYVVMAKLMPTSEVPAQGPAVTKNSSPVRD
ncbi:MAG: class B sortase [Oscillospiraceae bacterium]